MISVIIPVYNVEKYLKRCIESVLKQSYVDYEVLLIDDGSTDGSGRICDQYEKLDRRIRVFHKENGGLSDARNFGLDCMHGDYLTFIDSDDYVGSDYLKILVDMVEKNYADIASIDIYETHGFEFVKSEDVRTVLKGKEIMSEILSLKHWNISACGKIYKKQLFETVRFPIGKYYEDLMIIPYLINETSVFVFSTAKQYYYYQREGSIMHSISEESIENWMTGMEKLKNHVRRYYPMLLGETDAMFLRGLFGRAIDWNLLDNNYVEYAR